LLPGAGKTDEMEDSFMEKCSISRASYPKWWLKTNYFVFENDPLNVGGTYLESSTARDLALTER
jgi:hypothetical protein